MGFFIGWVVLCFLIAFVGSNKNIGYWGTFFLSLIFSPLIGLIIAVFSATKTNDKPVVQNQEVNKLMKLSLKAKKEKDYIAAVDFTEKALMLSPQNVDLFFNLACLYSLIKNIDMSYNFLENAVISGYNNFKNIQIDVDLINLRNDVDFKNFALNGYKKEQ